MGTRQMRDIKRLVSSVHDRFTIGITSKGHIRVTLVGSVSTRTIIASSTFSDQRWKKNFTADLERAARAIRLEDSR